MSLSGIRYIEADRLNGLIWKFNGGASLFKRNNKTMHRSLTPRRPTRTLVNSESNLYLTDGSFSAKIQTRD